MDQGAIMKMFDRTILRHLAIDFAAAAVGVAIVALPMMFIHTVLGI
jgi:ABC-type molybdate transport system permease subunit